MQHLLVAQQELVDDARDSTIVWVASSVLASCSPYSLNDTAASSCAMRSRGVRGGGKYSVPSKMWVLYDVGQ